MLSCAALWVLWKGFRVYLLYVVLGVAHVLLFTFNLMSNHVQRGVSVVTDPIRSVLWRIFGRDRVGALRDCLVASGSPRSLSCNMQRNVENHLYDHPLFSETGPHDKTFSSQVAYPRWRYIRCTTHVTFLKPHEEVDISYCRRSVASNQLLGRPPSTFGVCDRTSSCPLVSEDHTINTTLHFDEQVMFQETKQ